MLSYWTGPIDGRSYLDTEFETFYDGQAGMYWTVGTPDRFTEEATHLTLPPMMVLEHRFTVNWICHLPLFN